MKTDHAGNTVDKEPSPNDFITVWVLSGFDKGNNEILIHSYEDMLKFAAQRMYFIVDNASDQELFDIGANFNIKLRKIKKQEYDGLAVELSSDEILKEGKNG